MNPSTNLQISPELKAKLSELGFQKTFEENEVILRESSYIKAIPIVLQGSLRVMRTEEDGRELLLYYIKAGFVLETAMSLTFSNKESWTSTKFLTIIFQFHKWLIHYVISVLPK